MCRLPWRTPIRPSRPSTRTPPTRSARPRRSSTTNSAQQTVESAQQTVANAGTLAEREAALEIANAAVETAEQAVTEAQNALDTANAVYTEAEKAVEAAQKALDEITKEHNEAVGEAQGDLAAAKKAAQDKLDAAKAKLDDAGTARDELGQKAKDAQTALNTAIGLVTSAEDLLKQAKDNAAGLQVDVVLKDEQKQDDLKSQTEDVKGKKEALDKLGIDEDEEQAKADTAQKTVDELTPEVEKLTEELEGQDKEKTEESKAGAEQAAKQLTDEVEALKKQIAPLENECNTLESTIKNLSVWGNTATTLVEGGAKVQNKDIAAALAELEKTGHFPDSFMSYSFGKSEDEFVKIVQAKMASDKDKVTEFGKLDEYKNRYSSLYGQLHNGTGLKTQLSQKEALLKEKNDSIVELTKILEKFSELETKQGQLNTANGDLKSATEALAKVKEAKEAYGKAAYELSKILKGEHVGTGYDAFRDYEKLMADAAKLQTAIDKLNELNQAIEDRDKADAAQKQAQYDYDHAMAGLEAAEKALAKAQEKVDSAAANASKAELAKLTANLEKAKADFETAKKAADEAKENKDKADQAKTDADQNATNAANRVQDAINDLNNIGIGDIIGGADITIDDEAVPLASGPVTRAEFVDYLWRHEGSPAAESELFADHEYAPAIAWALSAELIDETFAPDELVTVADVRAILGSFADVFGTNAVAAADLTTLTGDDGEAVLNCDQVLAEFFGEEYELPEDLDVLETDAAA